jgi:hypothetical protein
LYYIIVPLAIIFSTIIILKIVADYIAHNSALNIFSLSWSSIYNEFSYDLTYQRSEKMLDLLLGEVTSVLSGNLLKISDKFVSLEGVQSLESSTPQNGIAQDKLEHLILRKKVKYDIKSRDEHNRIVAQVWLEDANINVIMKEYIKSLLKSPISKYITQ